MDFETEAIHRRIVEVAIREGELSESTAQCAAFHMTDWLSDLAAYSRFCRAPEKVSDPELNDLLLAFLIHVPDHVAAARKLYVDLPVTDVFGVGATTAPENQNG